MTDMTQASTPGPLSVGNLHTAIMEALAEDIQRQRPDAFREEDENGFEGDVIIPTGATPQSAFAKVNVSDLAEVILPLVAPTAPVEPVRKAYTLPGRVKETAENEHVAAPVEASGSEREIDGVWVSRETLAPFAYFATRGTSREFINSDAPDSGLCAAASFPAGAYRSLLKALSDTQYRSLGRVAYEGWAQGLPGAEWSNQTATQKRAWDKAAEAVIALRPQPSGETRAAVARLERMTGGECDVTVYAGPDKKRLEAFDADIRTVLAFLPARPLALGGQQGEADDVRDVLWKALQKYKLSNMSCSDDAGIGYPLVDLMSNDGTTIATGREEMLVLADHLSEALSKSSALSTTPARTEAQDEGAETDLIERLLEMHKLAVAVWNADRDPSMGRTLALMELGDKAERLSDTLVRAMLYASYSRPANKPALDEGAAGERESLIKRLRNIDNGIVHERPWIATELCDEAANALEAHPSPTPAADADRVRIAVEALEPFDKMWAEQHDDLRPADDRHAWGFNGADLTWGDFRRAAEALAALKSEGGK